MTLTTRHMATVYLKKRDKYLLLFRQGGRVVSEVWTGSAGGHFEPEELNDPTACVLREMKEETGLNPDDISGLKLNYITMRDVGGEIRINYYFFAELLSDRPLSSNEGTLRWFTRDELANLAMPHSARKMIDHYLAREEGDDQVYVCVSSPTGAAFTLLGSGG